MSPVTSNDDDSDFGTRSDCPTSGKERTAVAPDSPNRLSTKPSSPAASASASCVPRPGIQVLSTAPSLLTLQRTRSPELGYPDRYSRRRQAEGMTASVVDQFCDNQARMPAAPGVEFDRIVVGQEQNNSAPAKLRDVALRPAKTCDSVGQIRGSGDRRWSEDAMHLSGGLKVVYDFVQRRSCFIA